MNQRVIYDTQSREFKLESLVLKHKRNPDLRSRAKAQLEAEIVENLSEEDKAEVEKVSSPRKVLNRLLGGTGNDLGLRNLFLSREKAGFPIGPVWKALDDGFPHESVRAVLHEAVKASGSRGGVKPVVTPTFSAHLNEQIHKLRTIKGYTNHLKEGKKPPKTPEPKSSSKAASKTATKKASKNPDSGAKIPKPALHDQVVELITTAPHVADLEIPEGTDPDHYRASYTELIAYLRTVVYQSGKNFGNSKRRYIPKVAGSSDTPTQRRVRNACDTLDLKMPSDGEPIDLQKLRAAWLLAARQFHPDLNKTPYAARQFNEAKQAHDCLVKYNESISK